MRGKLFLLAILFNILFSLNANYVLAFSFNFWSPPINTIEQEKKSVTHTVTGIITVYSHSCNPYDLDHDDFDVYINNSRVRLDTIDFDDDRIRGYGYSTHNFKFSSLYIYKLNKYDPGTTKRYNVYVKYKGTENC